MKMILHIFRKDVRHLYPEIFILAVLFAAFGWAAPSQWNGGVHDLRGMLAVLLRFLLPIAWLVLISRLVHDESLAGDRQFWITRPYRWSELLASKALFILSFIAIPFLIVRMYLLHHAGLDVAHAAGPLAITTSALLLAIILPVTAISTVTTSFAKDILLMLIAVVYVFGLTVFYMSFTGAQMFIPGLLIFLAAFAGVALMAIITCQYAVRRTRTNGLMLVGLPAALLLILLSAPTGYLIHSAYPEAPGQTGKQISFDTSPNRQQPGGHTPNVINGNVFIDLPLSGVPQEQLMFRTNGGAVIVSNDHGFHWRSNYQPFRVYFANQMSLNFHMPSSRFETAQASPARLDLEFDVEKYRNDKGQPTRIGEDGSFVSAEGGNCSVGTDETSLACLYAVGLPDWLKIETLAGSQPCMIQDKDVKKPWFNYFNPTPAYYSWDFDPVVPMHLRASGHFCPGTEVQFTAYPSTGQERFNVAIDGVELRDYAWSKQAFKAEKSY